MSRAKERKRWQKWSRYIEKTSRTSVRHYDYPFGMAIKLTPGYFAPRRVMRYRGKLWYENRRDMKRMFGE